VVPSRRGRRCYKGYFPPDLGVPGDLTACAAEDQKLLGLDIRADDYIVKPFSPRDLVARVRVVLRRAVPVLEEAPPAPVTIGSGLAVALLLGLLFGSYWAQRAARLDPSGRGVTRDRGRRPGIHRAAGPPAHAARPLRVVGARRRGPGLPGCGRPSA
jgi:hypothetical protein